jgi:hypothetical protein
MVERVVSQTPASLRGWDGDKGPAGSGTCGCTPIPRFGVPREGRADQRVSGMTQPSGGGVDGGWRRESQVRWKS